MEEPIEQNWRYFRFSLEQQIDEIRAELDNRKESGWLDTEEGEQRYYALVAALDTIQRIQTLSKGLPSLSRSAGEDQTPIVGNKLFDCGGNGRVRSYPGSGPDLRIRSLSAFTLPAFRLTVEETKDLP